jgi:acetyl esterase/lipase
MTGKHAARLHFTIWSEGAQQGGPKNRKLREAPAIWNLPHTETTIAKHLHGAGYLTAMVGKWHLGDWEHYPEAHGFDINIGGTNWGAPQTFWWPYSGSGRFGAEFRYVPHLELGKPGEYLTDRLTDEAMKVIDHAGAQPFFIYLAHHAVHTPIEAKEDDVKYFDAKLRPDMHHQHGVYAAMTKNLDDNVGRVLDHLLFALSLSAQEPERIRDVIYTKHDGVALTMDVFKPVKPNGAGIIKIVSGGWKSNHNGISDGGWPKAGYTTFVVVHGTQPRFQVEEIVADLNRAVRFVRANAASYGVDPQKLGVTGSSAGGHLSLMLATRGGPGDAKAADPIDRESSAVNAVACFYPPTDYLNWFEPGDNAVGIGKLEAYAAAFGPKAATPEGREALGRELSSIYWVHKEQPPIFIVHGDADPQVSITQSERFLKRCHEVGTVCELVIRKAQATAAGRRCRRTPSAWWSGLICNSSANSPRSPSR